ncbi:CueP family metal-binding protein [Jeotgalibacillus sp. JSM ZJ347]|uniref:CueP family metal-binding protein n=1 Tax=Jeotgalibacillus sp. JSM ZJ347 TaxID=3342117 RepID=UPI0035A8E41C
MKFKSLCLAIFAAFLLAACSSDSESQGQAGADEATNIRELVQDFSTREVSAEQASITGETLTITEEDGSEQTHDITSEDFFVSIAPYVDQTHACTYHSLTGCQGEMVEETFDVYIEDSEGNVIIDESMTTFKNGFIDLWLPRDETYQLTIEHDGLVTESEISTFENDPTCITTMQLG